MEIPVIGLDRYMAGNINAWKDDFTRPIHPMVDTNPTINPVTGRQWDLNSLIEKLLELQDALLQSQERNIMLTAQARELERVARDAEDLKSELSNQGQLLADKSRENKHLHQELSRMAGILEAKMQEVEDLKVVIGDIQHQLKTCQQERDLLAVMLTDAENAARQVKRQTGDHSGKVSGTQDIYQPSQSDTQRNAGWMKWPRGKDQR